MAEKKTSCVQEPTAKQSEPKKLPKESLLMMHNLQLRMQNVQYQLHLIQLELQTATKTKESLVKEMAQFRSDILQDHGVDIATVRLSEDGTILGSLNDEAVHTTK